MFRPCRSVPKRVLLETCSFADVPTHRKPGAAINSNSSEHEEKPHQKQMNHTAGKGDVSDFHCGVVHKAITVSGDEHSRSQSSSAQRSGQAQVLAGLGLQESKTDGRNGSTGEERAELAKHLLPGGHRKRRQRVQSSIQGARSISFVNVSGKNPGYNVQAPWHGG